LTESDAISREIESCNIASVGRSDKEKADYDKEKKSKERIQLGMRLQAEGEARLWKESESRHGPLPSFSPGNVVPCSVRAKICLERAAAFRRERDQWITESIGPIHSKRKLRKKRREAEAADVERRTMSQSS